MASAPLGLAEIEAMIGDAEVEIVALRHRLACDGGPTPDPTDPLDELSCLEIGCGRCAGPGPGCCSACPSSRPCQPSLVGCIEQARRLGRRSGSPEQGMGAEGPRASASSRQIALMQIGSSLLDGVPAGVILGDAGYGIDAGFGSDVSELSLVHVLGVQSSLGI